MAYSTLSGTLYQGAVGGELFGAACSYPSIHAGQVFTKRVLLSVFMLWTGNCLPQGMRGSPCASESVCHSSSVAHGNRLLGKEKTLKRMGIKIMPHRIWECCRCMNYRPPTHTHNCAKDNILQRVEIVDEIYKLQQYFHSIVSKWLLIKHSTSKGWYFCLCKQREKKSDGNSSLIRRKRISELSLQRKLWMQIKSRPQVCF